MVVLYEHTGVGVGVVVLHDEVVTVELCQLSLPQAPDEAATAVV